jgi:adenylate kinase
LEVYHSQTQPLIDYYAKKNLLIKINGEGKVDKITEEIFKAVRNGGK